MDKSDLEKHGTAVLALICNTGCYAGPVEILFAAIEEILPRSEFDEVIAHLVEDNCATVARGTLKLTPRGITVGKNFAASKEIHESSGPKPGMESLN